MSFPVAASNYQLSLICVLECFIAIIKLLNWFLNSLSKERWFHEIKHLDVHWGMWLQCLWKHGHHPLVSYVASKKFSFSLVSTQTKLTLIIAWKVSVLGVILIRIQSEWGKIRTRITPNTDTFYAVNFELSFLDSIWKAGPSTTWSHDLVFVVHTL